MEKAPFMDTKCLVVKIGSKEYGIDILQIREIVRHEAITSIPSAPGYFAGVINLRGAVIPIIDLAARLSAPASAPTDKTCFIITEIEAEGKELLAGLMVDVVSQVVDFPACQIEEVPRVVPDPSFAFLNGLGKVESRVIPLLNVDRIFSRGEVQAMDDCASNTE